MSKAPSSDPRTADDWIVIAERELQNLDKAYKAQLSNDAKVDHALMATEALLKAILWKRHKWPKWPQQAKGTKFLYRHDLQAMLNQCGDLRTTLRLSAPHWASWQTIANISLKHARYSPNVPSDTEMNAIVKSVRHLHVGIFQWLLDRYHEMT